MPANENNMIKNEMANKGCFFEIPDKSEIFSLYSPSFFKKYKHEKIPTFITTQIDIYTMKKTGGISST